MTTAVQQRRQVYELTPHEKMARLIPLMKQLPQAEVPLKHHFGGGFYGREGFVAKGTFFIGRVHLRPQLNIISKGDILVLTETGLIRMTAPFSMVSPPGAQRGAYALEDTVWTTIIATDLTDPDLIYNTLTTPTYEEFQKVRDELLNVVEG
jgi:hypothetical protein